MAWERSPKLVTRRVRRILVDLGYRSLGMHGTTHEAFRAPNGKRICLPMVEREIHEHLLRDALARAGLNSNVVMQRYKMGKRASRQMARVR